MHSKWQQRLICIYFKLISPVAHDFAARCAYRLFHYPVDTKRKHWNEKPLPTPKDFTVSLDNGNVLQCYAWGDEHAPAVLLVHGWSTNARSMSHLIDALLQRGYRVISYDALRHGKSKAKRADLADWANSVRAVLAHIGHVRCIAAHSFGAAAVTVASKQRLNSDKLLFFAPIQDVISIAERFAQKLCIPDQIVKAMQTHTWIQNRKNFEAYGRDWEDLFNSSCHLPTLVFHDQDDSFVPIAHSHRLCQRWPWAKLIITKGLGHRKILDDQEVIRESIAFIEEDTVSAIKGR